MHMYMFCTWFLDQIESGKNAIFLSMEMFSNDGSYENKVFIFNKWQSTVSRWQWQWCTEDWLRGQEPKYSTNELKSFIQ